LKTIKAEQNCAEMKSHLEKSEIVAKLDATERKAQMAAQIEATCFLTLYNKLFFGDKGNERNGRSFF
jgi:hypothetical protein